jgi:hypothetical protein
MTVIGNTKQRVALKRVIALRRMEIFMNLS